MSKELATVARYEYGENHTRTVHDVSQKHCASYDFGLIYPCYHRFTHPNETVVIKPSMHFDFEPMNHQIRNRVRAHFRAFYVRDRALWSNHRNFIMQDKTKGTSAYVHPYISRTGAVVSGGLLDHLGVPCVAHSVEPVMHGQSIAPLELDVVDGSADMVSARFSALENVVYRQVRNGDFHQVFGSDAVGAQATSMGHPWPKSSDLPVRLSAVLNTTPYVNTWANSDSKVWIFNSPLQYDLVKTSLVHSVNFGFDFIRGTYGFSGHKYQVAFYMGTSPLSAFLIGFADLTLTASTLVDSASDSNFDGMPLEYHLYRFSFALPDSLVEAVNVARLNGPVYPVVRVISASSSGVIHPEFGHRGTGSVFYTDSEKSAVDVTPGPVGDYYYLSEGDALSIDTSRFDGSTLGFRLNALPVRAYRAIYNSNFRYLELDPFCPAVNPHDSDTSTVPYVDRYVENLDDGADTDTPLELERARYAEDVYNGCLPSPTMMADRPLVGATLSADALSADLTYAADPDGGTSETGKISLSLDGSSDQKITGITAHQGFDANHVTVESLKDAIKIGISLQDLQNVKSLTKWYEANYKGGRFSYYGFMHAHFGKGIAFDEKLKPEPLGGFDCDLTEFDVLNNAAPSADGGAPLGTLAAVGKFDAKKGTIECYSDEHGQIMCVVWFSLDNNMVDALNRQWFAQLPEDYPTTEFVDLGTQAMRVKEVAPLLADTSDPEEIFGYNGVYYYMREAHDTIAGEFNTQRIDELMIRKMTGKPALNYDFYTINPDTLTNIFASRRHTDKIYGHWRFDVKLTTWLPQRPNAQII